MSLLSLLFKQNDFVLELLAVGKISMPLSLVVLILWNLEWNKILFTL